MSTGPISPTWCSPFPAPKAIRGNSIFLVKQAEHVVVKQAMKLLHNILQDKIKRFKTNVEETKQDKEGERVSAA